LGAALLGAALSAKLGSIAYAIPLYIVAWFYGCLRSPRSLSTLVSFLLSGNPVFPFLNSLFRSPWFDTSSSFRDDRFMAPLQWRTLYDATFHTSRFFEGRDGALGYQYLLLAPLAAVLLFLTRERPWIGAMALITGVAGAAFTWADASNIRYCYAALPFVAIGIAIALGVARLSRGALDRTLTALAVVVTLSGLLLMTTSGWWMDFFVSPIDKEEQLRYLTEAAPGRLLVAYLNKTHRDRPVLFLVNGQSAGLKGRVYLNSWHNYTFYSRLHSATSEKAVSNLLNQSGIDLLIVPLKKRISEMPNTVLRSFVSTCTSPEYAVGGYAVARRQQTAQCKSD
jgi:hypothetical protein